MGVLGELNRLDITVYAAIAATPTPTLDRGFQRLSHAANYSKLSLGSAAVLAVFGGSGGRRAATSGVVSIALTSAVANLVLKPLSARARPDRVGHNVPLARHVTMPTSHSMPSGHAASASAFATGVSMAMPLAGIPLRGMAVLVGYSRVHSGVHYPLDVIAGAMVGDSLAPVAVGVLERVRASGRS